MGRKTLFITKPKKSKATILKNYMYSTRMELVVKKKIDKYRYTILKDTQGNEA